MDIDQPRPTRRQRMTVVTRYLVRHRDHDKCVPPLAAMTVPSGSGGALDTCGTSVLRMAGAIGLAHGWDCKHVLNVCLTACLVGAG
jgi:hypothetical protein